MSATYPQRLQRSADRASADPVVRATAETTTPDLAAIAALDAALAAYGIVSSRVEEVVRCRSGTAPC